MRKIVFLFLFTGLSLLLSAQKLTMHFSGIRNSTGTLRVQFYTNQQNFKDEKPLITKTVSKAGLQNGSLTLEYNDLKPGTYGIAILDDENNNQKMDYGLLLPKEGFGFSDYYHSGMSRPVFSQFDFAFGGADKTVEIKLRYM